ncbi:MAG: hypothetical protein FJX53_01040 [Alphaproteobacteria bacterium]|nr:hypothetical protein [Alphaproteobacteria bacterium]
MDGRPGMAHDGTDGGNPFARIAVFHAPSWRVLMVDVLRRIRARHGSALHVYVVSEQGRKFYARNAEAGLFDSVTVRHSIAEGSYLSVAGNHAELARVAMANERRYATTYNEIMMTDRHLGRGFSPGGFHHPRSRMAVETGYWQAVRYLNEEFAFWHDEFTARGITLLINPQKIPAVVARRMGIPMRTLSRSRIDDQFHWASNGEFFELPQVEAQFRLTPPPAEPVRIKTYPQYELNKRRTVRGLSLATALRRSAAELPRVTARRLLGVRTGYSWLESARVNLRGWHEWRALRRKKLAALGDLAGIDFVFHALQEEPEMTLSWQSPESLPQMADVWQLARDLPAGAFLAVKEHIYAVGRRPERFYDQLLEFKNVILVDPLESGIDLMHASKAVATISSTAGFEAAWVGKPVISFGRHNLYNFLDHVFDVEPGAPLAGVLHRIFADEVDLVKARIDGARFYQALKDLSFDLGKYDMANVGTYETVHIPQFHANLAASLGVGVPADAVT